MLFKTLGYLGRGSFFISCFLVGFILLSSAVFIFFAPASSDPNAPTVNFLVYPNDSFKTISARLEKDGLIKNSTALYYLVKLKGPELEEKVKKIKYGEYQISSNMKLNKIIDVLTSGNVIFYQFTIPEGSTVANIMNIISKSELISKDELALALNDSYFISNFNIPTRSFEGYLFPETYKFTKPITAPKIIERLVEEGQSRITPDLQQRALELGLSFDQVIILASIIEKETGKAEERPIISSVFHNRLRLDMPLQSDPTVIYGIPDFNGNLTREQLKAPTSYNTYVKKGLPPTAICNPGIDSIKAALYPADTSYLYFVAKGDGSHQFSSTYKEHQEAVNIYQKNRAEDFDDQVIKNKQKLQEVLRQLNAPKPTPTPTPTKKSIKPIKFLDPDLKEKTTSTPSEKPMQPSQSKSQPQSAPNIEMFRKLLGGGK